MVAALAAGIGVATALSGCGTSANGASTVQIVAYSVPKPAYDSLEPAFKKTNEGTGVSFSASHGASGSQSKAVDSGQPADYVGFSLEPDMTRLVPKYVASDWNSGPTKGIVSDSVVVLMVRKGNPKHIKTWSDLIKPGVKIVTPDPASSGSAKWNILAAY
ncbi:MAG: substrate-binding domain-containing protein, partial [Actinoallomurus sp.]